MLEGLIIMLSSLLYVAHRLLSSHSNFIADVISDGSVYNNDYDNDDISADEA